MSNKNAQFVLIKLKIPSGQKTLNPQIGQNPGW